MVWLILGFSLVMVLVTVVFLQLDQRRCGKPHHKWFGLIPLLDRRFPVRP